MNNETFQRITDELEQHDVAVLDVISTSDEVLIRYSRIVSRCGGIAQLGEVKVPAHQVQKGGPAIDWIRCFDCKKLWTQDDAMTKCNVELSLSDHRTVCQDCAEKRAFRVGDVVKILDASVCSDQRGRLHLVTSIHQMPSGPRFDTENGKFSFPGYELKLAYRANDRAWSAFLNHKAKGLSWREQDWAYLESHPRNLLNYRAGLMPAQEVAEGLAKGNLHPFTAKRWLERLSNQTVVAIGSQEVAQLGTVTVTAPLHDPELDNVATEHHELTAVGEQLDAIGELYGTRRRGGEPDNEYRGRLYEAHQRATAPDCSICHDVIRNQANCSWVCRCGSLSYVADYMTEAQKETARAHGREEYQRAMGWAGARLIRHDSCARCGDPFPLDPTNEAVVDVPEVGPCHAQCAAAVFARRAEVELRKAVDPYAESQKNFKRENGLCADIKTTAQFVWHAKFHGVTGRPAGKFTADTPPAPRPSPPHVWNSEDAEDVL